MKNFKYLEVTRNGEAYIVKFATFFEEIRYTEKIFDEQHIQEIGYDLFGLVDEIGAKIVIVDFECVEYISAAFLGKLMTLQQKIWKALGILFICAVNPGIHEVLEITKLDRFFFLRNSVKDALESF